MVGGQVLIIFIGGKAFNVVHLNSAQWAYSIILGFLSIPIGAVIRLIPDELLLRLIPDYWMKRPQGPEVLVSDEEEHFRFPKPLADVREELSFLKKVKGGRVNNLRFRMQQTRDTFLTHSRSGSRSRSNSIPQTPEYEGDVSFPTAPSSAHKRGRSVRSRSNSVLGATTVMAGIIAGSVAGWSPIERTHGDDEFAAFPRPRAKSDLDSRADAPIRPPTAHDEAPIATDSATTTRVDEIAPANTLAPTTTPDPRKPARTQSH
jgi:Ca2+-transporting ATPase